MWQVHGLGTCYQVGHVKAVIKHWDYSNNVDTSYAKNNTLFECHLSTITTTPV